MKIRVRGRSFMAFVIAPEPPLDAWLRRTRCADRPLAGLLRSASRHHRPCRGHRPRTRHRHAADRSGKARHQRHRRRECRRGARHRPVAAPADRRPQRRRDRRHGDNKYASTPVETSLLLAEPVRSGQSVQFTKGDVTIIGSVASGAEVLAGGSIHIYGTLRGRAIAGALGGSKARIFCRPNSKPSCSRSTDST